MPRINLLPWREELRQKRKKEFLLSALLAVIAGAGVTFGTKLYFKAQIENQEQRNVMLRNEIEILDRQIDEINQLDAQKSRLLERMEIIEQLQRSRPEAVHLVDELVGTLPPGTHYTNVTQTGNGIEVNGIAQATGRVSDLMRNVQDSAWLQRPQLGRIVTDGSGAEKEGEFVLRMTQVPMGTEGGTQQ